MRALPSSSLKPVVSSAFFIFVFVLFAVIFTAMFLCFPAAAQQSQPAALTMPHPLITQALDESHVKVLQGNTHPLARREFDLGTAPATLPMERMLLVLKRSPEQEGALRQLLDHQQDKHSPHYHKWLTPEQFGAQFGPSDADMQTITSWLQSHGFQVGTTKGRTVLEFSGSASQVQEAFRTSIHKYIVNGEQHWANASDPSIPAALAPAVAGVMTLHNFLSKPAVRFIKDPVLAQVVGNEPSKRHVTFPPQNGQAAIHALAPQDFATIYNINPAYNTLSGMGVTIGVVGRTDLYNAGQDVANFLQEVGSANGFFAGFAPSIILNGPDPGDAGGGELLEATLDATWASSIAPNAMVDFVVSGSTNTTDGVDLSESYIVDNNLSDIMTESFGSCEYYSTDGRLQGVSALAEQAAAQGITYFVSAGDNGAEGCDARCQ
jgi:subtilase family serine protease